MQARYIQRGESIDFVPERDIAAKKEHSAVLLFPECST